MMLVVCILRWIYVSPLNTSSFVLSDRVGGDNVPGSAGASNIATT